MDNTPNLQLPYLMAAQAQKHVTHNEALRALDAIVQLLVLDKDLASLPGSPTDGSRYIGYLERHPPLALSLRQVDPLIRPAHVVPRLHRRQNQGE